MDEEKEIIEDEVDHVHICMECGEDVPCDNEEECEDEFEDTVCKDCVEEDLDQIEDENDAV